MTTVIGIRLNDAVILAADTQCTAGNVKVPTAFKKVTQISPRLLLASAGSVGTCQHMADECLRTIKLGKILSDSDPTEIDPFEFARSLGSLNFRMPLDHKSFSPSSYLLAGITSAGEIQLFSIDDDGGYISHETFWSIGSGSQLALSQVKEVYDSKADPIQMAETLVKILSNVSDLDAYTNASINVFGFYQGKAVDFGDLIVKKPEEEFKK